MRRSVSGRGQRSASLVRRQRRHLSSHRPGRRADLFSAWPFVMPLWTVTVAPASTVRRRPAIAIWLPGTPVWRHGGGPAVTQVPAHAFERELGSPGPPAGTAAEQLAQCQRPPQVKVRVMPPGKADPAEYLDAILGVVDRGIERHGGGGRGGQRVLVRRLVRRACRVPRRGSG